MPLSFQPISAQARQTKPECLPEQLLFSAVGRSPRAASSRDQVSRYGQCAPHSSTPPSTPALASMPAAVRTCTASPLCEAQASASSASVSCSRSAASLSTSGNACRPLTAERGNTGRSMSPSATTTAPSASTTASEPWCSDSTASPRHTSTSTGVVMTSVRDGLLNAGDRPRPAAVGGPHEVPDLVERHGRAVVVFTDEAVEAHAHDLPVALGRGVEELGVELHDIGALRRIVAVLQVEAEGGVHL